MNFIGAKVPQEVVDALKAGRQIVAVLEVGGGQGFKRVSMHKRHRAPIRGRCIDCAPPRKCNCRKTAHKSPPIEVQFGMFGDGGPFLGRLSKIRSPVHIEHRTGQARRRIERAICDYLCYFRGCSNASKRLFRQHQWVLRML